MIRKGEKKKKEKKDNNEEKKFCLSAVVYQMNDASSGEPDGDEYGDELGETNGTRCL